MVLGLFAGIHLFIRSNRQCVLGFLGGHLDCDHMVDSVNIDNGDQAELEKALPFEAALDRANMFSVNMYLSWSLDELIKHNMASEEPSEDFEHKMMLAAKTMYTLKVIA
jgi:hypothetical protein